MKLEENDYKEESDEEEVIDCDEYIKRSKSKNIYNNKLK